MKRQRENDDDRAMMRWARHKDREVAWRERARRRRAIELARRMGVKPSDVVATIRATCLSGTSSAPWSLSVYETRGGRLIVRFGNCSPDDYAAATWEARDHRVGVVAIVHDRGALDS